MDLLIIKCFLFLHWNALLFKFCVEIQPQGTFKFCISI